MIHGYLATANGESLIPEVKMTSNFYERFIGLLGSKSLNPKQGLIISPCSSVHTIGMRYPIDLIFLNDNWIVLKTVQSLKPWRFAFANSASMVLEISANLLEILNVKEGQKLHWHEN